MERRYDWDLRVRECTSWMGDMNQYNKMCRELPTEALDEGLYDTVELNKQRYPKRLYQRAARARNFQNIMMRAGSRQLADVVIHHLKYLQYQNLMQSQQTIFSEPISEHKKVRRQEQCPSMYSTILILYHETFLRNVVMIF